MKIIPPLAQTAGAFARASTATYVNDAGLVTTAAVDEPRFQAGALLLEAAATNLLTYSDDFRNTAEAGAPRPWGQTYDADVEVALVSSTTPAGSETASKLRCTTTGQVLRQVFQNFAAADDAVVCVSCYAKAAEVSRVSLVCRTKFLTYPQISVDLLTGTVTRVADGPVAYGAEPAGGGWWRLWVAYDVGLGGNQPYLKIVLQGSGNTNYSGAIGDGVLLWGAQAEVGVSQPSSYIPTTSAAVTRAADVFTRGMLSNVPENDHAAYSAGTTYAEGDRVILTSTHRIYESLQAGNTGHAPDTSPTWWLDVAPTNRWAMFDAEYGTGTALGTSPLRVVLAPAYANSLALLGLAGTSAQVTVTDNGSAAVAYSRTVDLYNPDIADWYAYVFEPFGEVQEVALSDLPPFTNAIVTVTITGAPATGCALLALGPAVELGDVNLGVRVGLVDYSRKETDEFGKATFVKRAFSRRLSFDALIKNNQINLIYKSLSNLRATPCVWVVSENEQFQVLVLWGFFKDFSVTIAYQTHSQCVFEIEGLT